MKTIQGFNVLSMKFSATSSCPHEVYIKEHSVRNYDDKKPLGKTLFVLNVPPYTTESSLKRAFSLAGKVKHVIFQKTVSEKDKSEDCVVKCGFKVAYVVFDKREGLLKALKLNYLEPLSTEEQPVVTGLSRWTREYNDSVCNHDKLSEEAETFMARFDQMEAEQKLRKEEEVDEDGWTVVTKKGRKPGVARKESVTNKVNMKAKLKSKKKQLKNFYTFQIREGKMKAVAELRKKYESDKTKVEAMKKLRKFKPF